MTSKEAVNPSGASNPAATKPGAQSSPGSASAARPGRGRRVPMWLWGWAGALVVLVYGLAVVGFVWVLWSFTELEVPFVQDEGVNPIVRLCGSLVILSAGLVPLLLEAAWRGADGLEDGSGRGRSGP